MFTNQIKGTLGITVENTFFLKGSMIRNQKPPAVRQQVLFSPAVQQVADLPTDKQRELQTAVAELLLNTLTSLGARQE